MMTQARLAEEIGVDKTMVNRWVKGDSVPNGDKLIKIINLLRIHREVFPDEFKEEKDNHVTRSEVESLWERIDRLEKEFRKMKEGK